MEGLTTIKYGQGLAILDDTKRWLACWDAEQGRPYGSFYVLGKTVWESSWVQEIKAIFPTTMELERIEFPCHSYLELVAQAVRLAKEHCK